MNSIIIWFQQCKVSFRCLPKDMQWWLHTQWAAILNDQQEELFTNSLQLRAHKSNNTTQTHYLRNSFYGTCVRNLDTQLVNTSLGATCDLQLLQQNNLDDSQLGGRKAEENSKKKNVSVRQWRGTKHTNLVKWNHISHTYHLGCPPSQDASHHQDYYIFSRGSQPKPSFATVTGRGDNPTYHHHSTTFHQPMSSWNHPFQVTMSWISASV